MRTTARPGGRTARVRSDVLAATLDVLLDRGLGSLTIEEIAERSGVHRTTIHRRWPSRSALVAEALLEVSSADVPIPNTGRLRTDLVAFARNVRDAISSPLGRALVSALAQGGADPDLAAAGRRFWGARFDATRSIVQRAIDRGELTRRCDARLVIEAIGGPVWFRVFVVGEVADDRFVERVVDLVMEGLKGRRG